MRNKHVLLIGSGIVLIFLPFFGIPSAWKNIIFTLVGIVVTVIGFSLYKNRGISEFFTQTKSSDTYVESSRLDDVVESSPKDNVVPAAENVDRGVTNRIPSGHTE
ncbi:hypothetical protein COB55_00290 [Candidatus Wolfebacteria bacterium]|nr:MAG: hypothetical protein COB55_00290 [Candidatus Wolfebacteria bacterium]